MGIAYKDFTSKTKLVVARSHLKKCLELLNGKELDRRAILIIMRASVQLEHVFRQLNEAENCCLFSHKAIGFYLEYTSQGSEFPAPIVSRFSVNLDIEDKVWPNTMLSLVTLYSELLPHIEKCERDKWDPETLVKPIHNFFMNQWSDALASRRKGCAWAFATLDFSNYFTRHFRLLDTLNYLYAIDYILDTYREHVCNISTATVSSIIDFVDLEGRFAIEWGLFCKHCLFVWKSKLFFRNNGKGRRANKSKSKTSIESVFSTTLIYTNVKEHVKNDVSELPVSVQNLTDVLTFYGYCTQYFKKAKQYFAITNDKNQIAVIYSLEIDAAKYIPYFIPDRDKQLQYYKQRIGCFTHMKSSIKSVDLNIYDIIFIKKKFELIRIYGIILDMILEDAEVTEKRFEDIDTEVPNYMKNSVECIKMYVEMLDKLVLLGKKE
ncbi:hypothetical protein X777_10761 [Ooceraea biroi]|nr:hypothetical protein X777_10761 [Ooceraea biroi]